MRKGKNSRRLRRPDPDPSFYDGTGCSRIGSPRGGHASDELDMNDWFEAEKHVERAHELYEAGRWDEAETEPVMLPLTPLFTL